MVENTDYPRKSGTIFVNRLLGEEYRIFSIKRRLRINAGSKVVFCK